MAVLVNYGGFIAPLDPYTAEYASAPSTAYAGMTVIFRLGGRIYLVITGNLGARQVGVDRSVSPAQLWFYYLRKAYELNESGSWEKTDAFTGNQYVGAIENIEIIYNNTPVFYLKLGDTGIWPETYKAAMAGASVAGSDVAAEPSVLDFGVIQNPSGNVLDDDISWAGVVKLPVGSPDGYFAVRARSLDGGSLSVEWFINESAVSKDLEESVDGVLRSAKKYSCDIAGITYEYECVITNSLNGTRRSLTRGGVLWVTEAENGDDTGGSGGAGGGDGGGGDTGGGDTGGDTGDTVTPDAARKSFWRGFGSLVGMYGGIVSEADESVGTGEADSKGEYLRKMFWLGASCGAAMYGGGRFNT